MASRTDARSGPLTLGGNFTAKGKILPIQRGTIDPSLPGNTGGKLGEVITCPIDEETQNK